MRVLFITRKFPPAVGGMEQFSFGLTQAYGAEKSVWKWGGDVWHIVWWLPFVALRLIVTRSADVVHLMDGVLVVLGSVARLHRRRVVVTLHGLELTYSNPIYQWLFARGLRKVHGIVCVSQATVQILETYARTHRITLGEGGIAVNVIGHGVRAEEVSQEEAWNVVQSRSGVVPWQKIILLAGRLVARKGQVWFLEQVTPQLLKDPNTVVVIVGDGPERDRVQTAAHKLSSLPGRVIIRGRVEDHELYCWYACARVMVMPNRLTPGDVEGFGIVAIEAGFYGTPVVAADVQGIKDAVQHGVTGILVPEGGTAQFLVAVQTVLGWDTAKRLFIQQLVRQRFSWERAAQQYKDFFTYLGRSH